MHRPGYLLSLLAPLLLPTLSPAANLLTNPSFESSPDALAGWTATGNMGAGAASGYNAFSSGPVNATDGLNVAEFNGGNLPPNALLSQSFPTTPGTTYHLSFDYGVFSNSGFPQSLFVQLADSANNVLASLTATDTTPSSSSTHLFESYSLDFTAADATTTLRFADAPTNNTNSTDGLLDNVSVTPLPEPAALSLLLIPLARRRR